MIALAWVDGIWWFLGFLYTYTCYIQDHFGLLERLTCDILFPELFGTIDSEQAVHRGG